MNNDDLADYLASDDADYDIDSQADMQAAEAEDRFQQDGE